MREAIITVALSLAVAIGVGIWETASKGHLIRALGGVTTGDLAEIRDRELVCEAITKEEFQERPVCNAGYVMAQWCSGDCNEDDARVALCCHHRYKERQ